MVILAQAECSAANFVLQYSCGYGEACKVCSSSVLLSDSEGFSASHDPTLRPGHGGGPGLLGELGGNCIAHIVSGSPSERATGRPSSSLCFCSPGFGLHICRCGRAVGATPQPLAGEHFSVRFLWLSAGPAAQTARQSMSAPPGAIVH